MRKIAASILLSTFAATAVAQQDVVDQFEKRSQSFDGYTLPYRLFVPVDYDSTLAYPLVLALHGAGERGTDNERQIRLHRLATSWADPVNQAENPAFVVAPQVPPDDRWSMERPVDESDFSLAELTTLAILDSLDREFNIDPERVYITGLSMGGHGVWDLISRLPNRFSAAVPMSGDADPTQAPRLLHMPIWAFHGESDTIVRPTSARAMIQTLQDLGRDVVYTHCRRAPVSSTNFDCPGPISNAALADTIETHADLIFTSERNVGHGPWSVWYDHPLLADWLFSKRRVDPEAVTVTEPSGGAVWSGVNMIEWESHGPAGDSVEVWLSMDDGRTWDSIGKATLGAGSYSLDTSDFADAAVAMIRLYVINENGRVYGRQTSEPFTIDNEGDAAPFLVIDDEPLRFSPEVVAETLGLRILAADPERGALDMEVFYSLDGGTTFALAESAEVASRLDPQIIEIDLAALSNSAEAGIRVDLSDGVNSTSAETASFIKATARNVNDFVEHVEGEGAGTITLHFVEPERLTNHRYQITFDDSDPFAKTYTVTDLDLEATVLENVPLSDGVRESPIFDGMSLVVQDLEEGRANLEETGWIVGDTDLSVRILGGSVLIAVIRVQLLETENDYEITVTEAVADTSVAGFGLPAREVYFGVVGLEDGERRKVLYRDEGEDGRLGGGDVLYILEEDRDGELAPAWELRFSATAGTTLPEPGDTFLFVPVKKLSSDDVFEFIAMEGVDVEDEEPPDEGSSLRVYPNPFSDQITALYRLTSPADVTLDVYDVLGRRVALLVDGARAMGSHQVTSRSRFASGLHLVRMMVRPVGGGRTKTIKRAVVRVD